MAVLSLAAASLISSLIGAGSSIINAKRQANAQLQANQNAINQQNVNNIINNNNQLQQQYNSNDYNDMYKDRVSMLRCGGSRYRKKAQYGIDDYTVRDNTSTKQTRGTGTMNRRVYPHDARYDAGVTGFVPVVGDALTVAQTAKDVANKDYVSAAMLPISLLLGTGISKGLKNVGRKVLRKGRTPVNKAISEEKFVDNQLGKGAYKAGIRKKDVKDILDYEDEILTENHRFDYNDLYDERSLTDGYWLEREGAAERLGINWDGAERYYNDKNYRNLIDGELYSNHNNKKTLIHPIEDYDDLPFAYGGKYINRSDYLKCGGNRKMKCGGRK